MTRARSVGLLAATLACSTLLTAPAAGGAPLPRDGVRHIAYRQWETAAQLRAGLRSGVEVAHGHVVLDRPTARTRIDGTTYRVGSWTSPWVRPGFALTELVPSWSAGTPTGTLVSVQVRGVTAAHRRSSWDDLGRWAGPDTSFRRTSLGPQGDDLGHVATDTWEAGAVGLVRWQVRVLLLSRPGSRHTPVLRTVGAMASALPRSRTVTTSAPGVARGVVLPVPRYSQMVHRGEYPRYGGGGEAWCSPTATAMVLAYDRRLPRPSSYAWVRRSYQDRVVDHVARMTFDHGYDGTGNWPFNTAYAASRTGAAFVTRFRSLRGVEQMVRAGIPVVTSISFARGGLVGAPIGSTSGHLVVVVGFTRSGDVVVNDPAAATRAGVRRIYDRGQFEDAWLPRYPLNGTMHGSGGIGYVIRDSAHPLPARTGTTSW